MAWKLSKDPKAPPEPRKHSPTRCMNCGHEETEHDEVVGCLVGDGTKWVENELGEARQACSCAKFIKVEGEANDGE